MGKNLIRSTSSLASQSVFTAPGKVFLLGEYAILAQRPALVAAIGPRFEMRAGFEASLPFPMESPIGKFIEWTKLRDFPELSLWFKDPYLSQGGFGASTAQFVLAYFAWVREGFLVWHWEEVLKLYRQLMSQEQLTPSGADLVTQHQGGVLLFDPDRKCCENLWGVFNWSNLLVFSATHQEGRKVLTHQHLETLKQKGFPNQYPYFIQKLEDITWKGIHAIRDQSYPDFGKAMDSYADALYQEGLEVTETFQDRKALRSLPGVLGVKGTGALQADAVIVLMDPQYANNKNFRESIIQLASHRGLRLVSDGLQHERGTG